MTDRWTIELHCQRVPKEYVYDGKVVVFRDGFMIDVPFKRRDMQDVAVTLHHATRMISSTGDEFNVRMIQTAPNGNRKPVPMAFTLAQVQKIYASVESARAFFAPTIQTKKEEKKNETENV